MGATPDGEGIHRADIVAILLAAGRGSRFDADEGKLRQPFGAAGQPLAVQAAHTLLQVLPVVAVVAHEDALAATLRQLGCTVVMVDAAAPREMSASLRRGIVACEQAAGWVIALADMPLLQPPTIDAIAAALRSGADIAAPTLAGKRGHPVGFSRHHRDALLALRGDQGARALLAAHAVTEIAVDDIGIAIDIDTADDLARYRPG